MLLGENGATRNAMLDARLRVLNKFKSNTQDKHTPGSSRQASTSPSATRSRVPGALSEEESMESEEDIRSEEAVELQENMLSGGDMEPEHPDMALQVEEPRFDGDLYSPRFLRGSGNKREGYCDLCEPGHWLVLKNSSFWYHKTFIHGISAANGQEFAAPKATRRMNDHSDVWEGLCSTCEKWIILVANPGKGNTWFRHAYNVSYMRSKSFIFQVIFDSQRS